MCVGSEHFNLCICGCPESLHQTPGIVEELIFNNMGFSVPGRGKCLGQVPIHLDKTAGEIIQMFKDAEAKGEPRPSLTKPCECQKFEQAWKPMCRMP